MKPSFIYFKEIALSNDKAVYLRLVRSRVCARNWFLSNNDYYITSLDCKLKVKNHIHDDKEKKMKNYLKKVDFYLKKEQHIKMI